MTIATATEVELESMRIAIDRFAACEQEGSEKLSPEEVISLVQDVCIELRCKLDYMPRAISVVYADAVNRRDKPNYGHGSFITSLLIHDMERALDRM